MLTRSIAFLLLLTMLAAPSANAAGVKCAIAQFTDQYPDEADKDADRLEKYCREAASKGAILLVAPECCLYRYDYWEHGGVTQAQLAAKFDNLVSRFSKLAKELKLCIVFGLREPSNDPKKPYQSAVYIDHSGTLIKTYRKRVPSKSERSFTTGGGNDWKSFNTPFGKCFMQICKDMDGDGYTNNMPTDIDYFIGLSKDPSNGWQKVDAGCAKAKCYGIGSNWAGGKIVTGSTYGGGNSGFVGPNGKVISQAGAGKNGQNQKVIYETLDLAGGSTAVLSSTKAVTTSVNAHINIVMAVKSGYKSGPWCSSHETGDNDMTLRPELHITYQANGVSNKKMYKRPIGSHNPLMYVIEDKQGDNNYYDRARPDIGIKQGDSFHIKGSRKTIFQCDISDIPATAKITAVTLRAFVHRKEGGASDGVMEILKGTKPWEKDKVTYANHTNYIGESITNLQTFDSWKSGATFVKGKWWEWKWDDKLVAYAQKALGGNPTGPSRAQTTAHILIPLSVYQHPNGHATAQFANPTRSATVVLYDISGALLFRSDDVVSNTVELNTSHFPAGRYVISVLAGTQKNKSLFTLCK